MDVNLDPLPAQIAYRLTAADGTEVAAGRVAAPVPGTPLLLLVPAQRVPAGRYEIELGDAAAGADTSHYRFEVR
jgi:hypothetical protein